MMRSSAGDATTSGSIRGGRLLLGVVVAVLALAGCSGSSDDGSSGPPAATSSTSSAPSDAYPYDTTFSGDDLLSSEVSSLAIPGTSSTITWRFPAGFVPDDTLTNANGPDDESYVGVSADLDTDLDSAVESVKRRMEDRAIRTSDVTVNGRDGVALSVDIAGERTVLGVYFMIDDSTVVAVQYGTYTPDQEPTPATVRSFNQMAASVALTTG